MRTQSASYIQNWHIERVRLFRFPRIGIAMYIEVGAFDVAVYEQGQVGRVDVTLEVTLVHLHQVVIPLFRILNAN